ncbi:prenyltransferase/squalene oxidase repeat-containing protein [Rhodopirellula bahusiensis]|uniref:Squalene--hopene cyclase n=1 Tax=Rhodopirellula bahusiensis TaxID=2014065 RepID=A0A2G1W4F9_9BACT|nr:prenyltransferase/squalene oxidase repeat-containing protein [Rhodopirellula bahusiensis]PHQ33881.1 squalene--hopene cyclase [Rhodopirellula bahusiensis]
MTFRSRVAATSALIWIGGVALAGQPAWSQDAARSIQRGLQYVQQAGERWIEKRGCVSCHQIPTLIWSHEAARRTDSIAVSDQLDDWERWSTDVVNFVKPEQKANLDQSATMAANIDTMTQLLLAIPRTNASSAPGGTDWRLRFAEKLLEEQSADGSWRACGQLPAQRRPTKETTATTTAWTALALMREPVEFEPSTAIQFVDSIDRPESTEFLATRLLLAHEMNRRLSKQSLPPSSSQRWRSALLDHQNDDGGWGWKLADTSDALGTGYALHALAMTGADSNVLDRAVKYLVATQEPSGRWKVPGTKASAKGKATPTANDWGSAWAVIALSTNAKQSTSVKHGQ